MIPDRGTDKIGQFTIHLSDAAPQPGEGEEVNRATNVIFLLRFEETMSHNVSYMWVVSAPQFAIGTSFKCTKLIVLSCTLIMQSTPTHFC